MRKEGDEKRKTSRRKQRPSPTPSSCVYYDESSQGRIKLGLSSHQSYVFYLYISTDDFFFLFSQWAAALSLIASDLNCVIYFILP